MRQQKLLLELEQLRHRLDESEETLRAIRSGEVDAIVVSGPAAEQVYVLKGAEQPYRVFLETMSEGAATLTASGVITYSNRRFAELLRTPLENLIGASLERFAGPEDSRLLSKWLQEALGESVKQEVRLVAGDGASLWMELSLAPVAMGDARCVCVVANDITERKQAERQIKELNAGLERRVAERTAALMAANKELESFSYSVSHDLRAPLRAIHGFCRALVEDYGATLDAQATALLERVQAASDRMDLLISGILALSYMTTSPMSRTTVDLSATAQAVGADLQRANPDRKVDFLVAPNLSVNADPSLLRSVLENLLGNAWKFTSKHPQARIEVGMVEHQGRPAYFVRDDGAGFDMRYADKLFGAFQRLHTPQEFEGTGVGLATVQRIIHRHGGKIWAEAAPEKGAVFFFTLPGNGT